MIKVLVVEDDIETATAISEWLTKDGYLVECCYTGRKAIERLSIVAFDVIVLDLILPDIDGADVCLNYRKQHGTARVLVLTGRDTPEDKEFCLYSGADDYITKPANLKELSARVRALMRRTLTMSGRLLEVNDLKLNLDTNKVTRGSSEISLQPQELALLEFFMRHQNRIFNAETLLARVWRGNSSLETVRTHIKTLRRKIDKPGHPKMIKTVHGIGYSLEG